MRPRLLAVFYPGCIAKEVVPAMERLSSVADIAYATPDGNALPEMKALPPCPVAPFTSLSGSRFQVVLVPGGDPGSVIDNSDLTRVLKEADDADALIAAVCAGPSLLDRAGLLRGKTIAHGYTADSVAWLRERGVFTHCTLTEETFQHDDRIFTDKPEGAEVLARELEAELLHREKVRKIFTAPIGLQIDDGSLQIIERPGWFQVLHLTSAAPEKNEVILSVVKDDEAERVIDETIAQYRKLGHPLKWCVGPLTKPARTGELLAARGFRSWEVRGMACDPMQLSLPIPPEVEVCPLTMENLDAFIDTQLEFFAKPGEDLEAKRKRFRANFEKYLPLYAGVYFFFLAYWNGTPVGTSGFSLKDGDFAYLHGAEVKKAFHGRGIYKALIEARLKALRDRGLRLAVTQAREATSAPILERIGFETVYRSKCYLLDAELNQPLAAPETAAKNHAP